MNKQEMIIRDIIETLELRDQVIDSDYWRQRLTPEGIETWDNALIYRLCRTYFLDDDKAWDLLEKQKKLHKVKKSS